MTSAGRLTTVRRSMRCDGCGLVVRRRPRHAAGVQRRPARRRDHPPRGRRSGRAPRGRTPAMRVRRRGGGGRFPHGRRHRPDPRRLARAEAGAVPEAPPRRCGRARPLGDLPPAHADGPRGLRSDGGVRGVRLPLGALSRGPGPRPGVADDDPGRRRRVDLEGTDDRFPLAEHVLDVFHASQYLATAAAGCWSGAGPA